MYGSAYNADLASDLGCELGDDGAIAVDDRRETSVDGVYAVGDVTHGQNQTTIVAGDGAYAGLAIHKDLRRFPVELEELEDREAETNAADSDELEIEDDALAGEAPAAPSCGRRCAASARWGPIPGCASRRQDGSDGQCPVERRRFTTVSALVLTH